MHNPQPKGEPMAIVTKDKLDRAYEAYKNGKLSRRRFLKYLGLAGASLGCLFVLGGLEEDKEAGEVDDAAHVGVGVADIQL